MNMQSLKIRSANKDDLNTINQVIEMAIKTWKLPERVKRLALPSYHYNEVDLAHYSIVLAEIDGRIIGVVAWDTALHEGPASKKALLLHGIYVHPEYQRRGVGKQLFDAAEDAARANKTDGIMVKAQIDAEGFYQSQGLSKLETQLPDQDYAIRYWKPLNKQLWAE